MFCETCPPEKKNKCIKPCPEVEKILPKITDGRLKDKYGKVIEDVTDFEAENRIL